MVFFMPNKQKGVQKIHNFSLLMRPNFLGLVLMSSTLLGLIRLLLLGTIITDCDIKTEPHKFANSD